MLNDNNEKLLKMKEKLIKTLLNNSTLENNELLNKTISEYLNIAKIVDENNLQNLINEIDTYNPNITKEEEYSLLEKLEDKYEELELSRNKVLNLCEKYQDINFSNLNIINIQAIRNRKNNINGYLIIKNKITSLEEEMSKLNNELFKENKKYSQIKGIIAKLEQELINNFSNAEGRIINDNKYEYASIYEEYKQIDIDINKINNNLELLRQKNITAENIKKEKDELFNAAAICYETIPSKENKLTLAEIEEESTKANYNLCLIKILNLIFGMVNNYELAKEKRAQIKSLIKYRKEYLKEMSIKYFIDPMDRIKIEEQLTEIAQIEDNTKEALKINKRLKEITTDLELLHEEFNEYNLKLLEDFNFINNNTSINEIIEKNNIEPEKEFIIEELPNKIVNIKESSKELKLPLIKSKTANVINRVAKMMLEPKEEIKHEEDNPIITIETVKDSASEDLTFDVQESPFIDSIEIFDEKMPIIEENNIIEDKSKDSENSETIVETKEEEIEEMFNDDIFQEVNPFEDTKIFDDKKEEEIELTEEELSDKMPDIFWDTPEELKQADDNFDLTFIEKNDKPGKTKKLVI